MAATEDFTEVVVIYNPNSTGPGQAMAQQLKDELQEYDVRLIETEFSRHAEELAYKYAKASSRPLVISASGDGGYNEVVNGLLQAQREGARPVAGLLPAGNANDHFHDVHSSDVVTAIKKGQVQQIDVLKLTATVHNKPFERYAHSYIGIGLTPQVGAELNKVKLHWFNEKWIVLKALFMARPVKIIINNKSQTYDSLLFSNVSRMSKVLSLSKQAANDDGKFEVAVFTHRSRLQLLKALLKASTIGLSEDTQEDTFTFRTIKKVLIQTDGEVFTLDANTAVSIGVEPSGLTCIV